MLMSITVKVQELVKSLVFISLARCRDLEKSRHKFKTMITV